MAKSLNEFISATKQGLANTSHFAVLIKKPKIINAAKFSSKDIEKILLFCETASLPSLTFASSPTRTFGEPREIPYERMFDNVSMTFLVDKNMKVKMFFDDWIAGIQNPYTRQFSFYNDYTTDLEVEMYDKENNIKYKATMYEAWPKNIAAIEVSNNAKDVMRITVNFQFRYWTTHLMQNLGAAGTTFRELAQPNQSFEVPDKIWNNFIDVQDKLKNLA